VVVELLPKEHHSKTIGGGTDVDCNNGTVGTTVGIFNGTKHTEKIIIYKHLVINKN